jgi:hypothetical protein
LEILALDELQAGRDADEQELTDAVLCRVSRMGRHLQRDGQPVTDPAGARDIVSGRIRDMLEHRLPAMRRLGALARGRTATGQTD